MSAGSRRLAKAWNEGFARTGLSVGTGLFLLTAGLSLQLSTSSCAQGSLQTGTPQSQMQRHYDAAFDFQNEGKTSQADSEYKLYLGLVLRSIADGHANLGDYAHAVPLFEEALRLTPDDRDLAVDYAAAALDAADWGKAKALAASVVDSPRANAQVPDAHAVSLLAQALLELGEHQQALQQFKRAAELQPSIESSSHLAAAYLVLGDQSNAAKILQEIPARFGNTATLHMQLGNLYGDTKFFDAAIREFDTALAMDDRIAGAHYSLGATYMMQSGEPAFEKAEAEFRKELLLDPNNVLVYSPLGRIALDRHRYPEAEADLKRAVEADPANAGTYLILGQLYKTIGKVHEAEAAFRKAIALTLDPSRNGYQIEEAHFWLGRLLMKGGDVAEGRKELDIARNLLYLKEQQVESRLSGFSMLQPALKKTRQGDPEQLSALQTFEKQASPVIASSYDNLGVNAAKAGSFANATAFFTQAQHWNPALPGVDEYWSRAAFAANEYAKAVEPLSRMLKLHPSDTRVRAMLGMSLCTVHDYSRALHVLQPMEGSHDVELLVALASAGSMASAGDSSQALVQLKSLEQTGPDTALVHYMLGEVYAGRKQYSESADELHRALQLDPSNADTKNALARADLALGNKSEALQLLQELAQSVSNDGEIFYRLGKLQIELGSPQAAIDNLKIAIKLDPMNASYHTELSGAYRRSAQPEEAEREFRQSESLQAQGDFDQPLETGNSEVVRNPGEPAAMQKN